MISPKTAAERLGLSPTRVRALIKSGKLIAEDVGLDRPIWAIDETELERFAALTRPTGRPRKETAMEGYIVRTYADQEFDAHFSYVNVIDSAYEDEGTIQVLHVEVDVSNATRYERALQQEPCVISYRKA